MRIILSLLSILLVVAIACNKDKFQTKPTIRIKSISGDLVPANGSLVITLECTDKEGDVKDTLVIIKNRLNKRTTRTVRDTLWYRFPDFPNNMRTEIVATLNYQDILSAESPPIIPGSNPPQNERDTLILKLAVKDNAGNGSDTISTKQIIVVR
ncbi:MAG TPA: hypothetical protein VN451_03520 [Chitinophagaceae bacterium]|nr:hypothetical protein [Chitinophagaceae bacterium]